MNVAKNNPASTASRKISIIILQYNNSQDTIKCLESVKELNYPAFEIIVVDNNSQPEHFNNVRLFIESQPANTSRFTLHASHSNLGYAGGNNVGIRQALENGADYVLILNPDTTVEPGLLTKLVGAGEKDEKVGLAAPAIDEGSHITYGGRVDWLKPELTHLVTYDVASEYLPGACLLIKRSVIEKIGLLDESYFLYFEDADYCMRARQAGFALKLVPEVLVRHRVSASAKQLGAPFLLRYHFRNALYFNWRHAPAGYKILLPFWSFFIMIKQLVKIAFLPNKRKISKAILAGVLDFHLDNFGKINDQSRN